MFHPSPLGQLMKSKNYDRKGETRIVDLNRMTAEIKVLTKKIILQIGFHPKTCLSNLK